MRKNINTEKESRILEKTLESMEVKNQAPIGVLILLLAVFFASAIIISITAGSQEVVMFGKIPVAVYTFAGILSSVSNMCIILMVIFCGKPGFIVAVSVMMIQIPLILIGITVKHNYTSLPGLFTDALTIIAIIVIFYNKRKLENYQLKLREQATTDILTGLPNGFASTELINELVKQHKPFVAATMDINDFKSINDTMGFDMGNKVLVEVASRLKEIAEKINIDGYDFFISASFGYAIYPSDAEDRDELINYSVAAMREIKRKSSSEHILRFTSEIL
ncbi:MAG: diguanylate cyclase [Lachnospiraceae bacterium]|nr:diguanylate cyclase [Lachnospiraceae bacterium]